MNNTIRAMGKILATSGLLLLAGCVTPGSYGGNDGSYGGSAGGYGPPGGGYPSQYGSQLQGTVDSVDRGYSRIFVVIDDPRNGRAQRIQLRYDQNTRLVFQGREQSVEGLERGDVIRFEAVQSGGELLARSIEVVRNARDGGYGGGYANDNDNDLHGSIALVDTRARQIHLEGAGYGNDIHVTYDARTTVEYQGRSFRPENLQRGDQVHVLAREVGNHQWLAERIIVERSVGH